MLMHKMRLQQLLRTDKLRPRQRLSPPRQEPPQNKIETVLLSCRLPLKKNVGLLEKLLRLPT